MGLLAYDTGDAYPEMTAADRSALESRAGVESLDALHDTRRALVSQIAPLKALHGPFGLWDARRQQMGRAMMVRARMNLRANGEKTTEAMVESEALGDPQYAAFLDQAERDKTEYIVLENGLNDLNERIRSRELELAAYSAEARLQR